MGPRRSDKAPKMDQEKQRSSNRFPSFFLRMQKNMQMNISKKTVLNDNIMGHSKCRFGLSEGQVKESKIN